jgi:hypothetical protein
MTVGIAVDRHTVWHERIESHDLAFAVPDDLRVGISPEEQVRHERFPENKGRHLRIRLIMQEHIQRMFDSLFLAAAFAIFV